MNVLTLWREENLQIPTEYFTTAIAYSLKLCF
jgi:hypothetical protein